MIGLNTKKEVCPICGNMGKNFELERDRLKNCPMCGTVYNEFGIILTQDIDDEMMKNRINNN